MHLVPKYSSKIMKYYGSIWSPEYQKQLITNESANHDWNILLEPNKATVVAMNNHKFELIYTPFLEHVSCSCQRFVDDGLNWCQHLAALKKFIDNNYKTFRSFKHNKKPNFVFYNSLSEIFYLPSENKIINKPDLFKYKSILTSAAKNVKIPQKTLGFKPDVINPFSFISTYPYQDKAILHMLKYKRTIISLEMGWGKTLCALICSKHILDKNPNSKILIICPKSLKTQWKNEIEKFIPNATIQNVKNNKESLNNSDFTIINYEMARKFEFKDNFDVMILDEVQKIKNKSTQSWKAISKIKTEWCWALSGTVVENNVEDFLSVADILQPDLFKVRWKFYDKFCEVDKNLIKGFKNSKDLNEILEQIIYRAPDNESPLSLNLKEHIITVGMTPAQKKIHDQYYQEVKRILAISMTRPLQFFEKTQLSAYQTRSRQACDSIQLINPNSKEISNKIISITDLIEKVNGKVVLFSEWKEFLSLLESEFKVRNITSIKFDGNLSQSQRKFCLNKFINDPEIKVFLSSDIGGTGIDGLQKVSNTIIHAQMSWNPAKLQQRNGRLFRIGQKDEVNSYLFISKDSIEESIVKTHDRKTKIKEVIFGKND